METIIHVGSRKHLPLNEVVMIQADLSYCHIFMVDGTRLLVSTHLQKLQERFDKNLIRVHRSFLINPSYIDAIDGSLLKLQFGFECTVSRRKRKFLS
jgi:DNA-binding LytR/AlgR family response regulator